jgi:hypothetical protein
VHVSVGNVPLPPGGGPMILIEHEVADQAIATFKAVSERKEGTQLDESFVAD